MKKIQQHHSPVQQLKLRVRARSKKTDRRLPAHMPCKKIAEYICGELDEHIDSPQCRAIKKHLESCPNCTAYLDSLKKTIHFYQCFPAPKLSSRCRKDLYSHLHIKNP